MMHSRFSDLLKPTPRRIETAVLLAILIFGAVTRFKDLGGNPPGLNCDEAAIGVCASSLLSSGHNLYGEPWPLYHHERSFAHWGAPAIVYPPLQLYATIPFVWALGRTEAAVRAPSACFALLAILGCYVLGKELFGSAIGLIAAAFLTLSPWHYHLGRIAIEPMSLSAALTWEAYFLWRGRNSLAFLLAGAATAAAATYAYPPGRLFSPLLAAIILFVHRKAFWERRWDLLWAGSLAALLVLPNVYVLLSQGSQSRMYSLLLWTADIEGQPPVEFLRRHSDVAVLRLLNASFPLKVAFLFLCNWANHYSPQVLFLERSGSYQLSLPGQGMILLLSAPLLLAGLLHGFRTRRETPSRFVLVWFLTFPIPASMTINSFDSARSVTAFPVPELLCAVGVWSLCRAALRPACGGPVIGRRWSWSAGVGVFLAVLTAGEGFYRLRQYHAVYRGDGARYWDYGIRQALGRTRSVANADESIIISDSIMNGYMFFLFYSDGPYPTLRPEVTDFSGLLPSKFLVHGPVSPPPPGLKALWILRPQELSKHASGHVVETLSYPTGETCLFLVRETTE